MNPGESEGLDLAIAKELANSLGREVNLDLHASRVETPAVAESVNNGGPDRWLVDAGSGFDLVGVADVPGWAMDHLLQERFPIDLHAATGITTVDKEATLQFLGPAWTGLYPHSAVRWQGTEEGWCCA